MPKKLHKLPSYSDIQKHKEEVLDQRIENTKKTLLLNFDLKKGRSYCTFSGMGLDEDELAHIKNAITSWAEPQGYNTSFITSTDTIWVIAIPPEKTEPDQ